MRVIGDKNQISEDVFDLMISYLPFPQKSIRFELAKVFFHQYNSHFLISLSFNLACVYMGKQPGEPWIPMAIKSRLLDKMDFINQQSCDVLLGIIYHERAVTLHDF